MPKTKLIFLLQEMHPFTGLYDTVKVTDNLDDAIKFFSCGEEGTVKMVEIFELDKKGSLGSCSSSEDIEDCLLLF